MGRRGGFCWPHCCWAAAARQACCAPPRRKQAAAPHPAGEPPSRPTPAVGPSTNPLTGLDDGDYTGKRPVAVTLRTLDGAQPQWGIASADVLIEGVTEGNTAGLTALFADVDRISKVGPVGPGRDLFLQVALPLNAVPVSIDKNVYASNLLNTLGIRIWTATTSARRRLPLTRAARTQATARKTAGTPPAS